MESHNKDYVDPKLKMKRGGYGEKESERYADDCMFSVFFFLSRYLKTFRLTINLYLLSYCFVSPPIAISALANCEKNLKQFDCSILPSIE